MPRRISRYDILALVLVAFGGVLAGIGWLLGIWMLWSSPTWHRDEKLIGTFILPGGILLPLLINFTYPRPHVLWGVLIVLSLITTLATPAYLAGVALRRQAL